MIKNKERRVWLFKLLNISYKEQMEKSEIIKIVDERVTKELEGVVDTNMLGYIHIFERRKKEILKKEYGIEFQTIQEKNTGCCMD